jgi:PAS domain S-box-containing protein
LATAAFYLPYLLTLAFLISAGVYVNLYYKESFLIVAFIVILIAQVAWTVSCIGELSTGILQTKLIWNNIQKIAMLLSAWTTLAFALVYSGVFPLKYWTPWYPVALLHLPLEIALFLKPAWFRSNILLVPEAPINALYFTRAPGMSLIFASMMFAGVASIGLIVQCLMRSNRHYRPQTWLILGGILIPFLACMAHYVVLRLSPNQNFVPLAFIPGDFLALLGMHRHKFHVFIPVAREVVFERMSDPVMVLNQDDQVVDINRAALNMIGVSEKEAIGKDINSMLSIFPELTEERKRTGFACVDINLPNGFAHRKRESGQDSRQNLTYNLSLSPLKDRFGNAAGSLIILRDITEQRRAQNALREANNTLEQRVEERTRQLNETIQSLNKEIADRIKAEKAKEHYIARMKILHSIDQAILEAKAPDHIARAALTAIRSLVPYEQACVLVDDPVEKSIVMLSALGNIHSIRSKVKLPAAPGVRYQIPGSKKPVIISDLPNEKTAHPLCNKCLAQNIHFLISAPLLYQDQPIGAINFCWSKKFKPSREQLEIAQEIAAQLAIAIHQANLLENIRRQVSELEALNRIARDISSDLDLDQVMENFLRQAAGLVGADAARLILAEPKTGVLHTPADYTYSPAHELPPFNPDHSITGQTFHNNQFTLVDDYPNHPLAQPEWVEAGLKAIICAPVAAGEYRVGMLNLLALNRHNNFNAHNLELAKMIASQAGLAIRNVQLYNSAHAAAEEIANAYDATIQGWALALELREKETAGHSHRVITLSYSLAHALNFTPEQLLNLRRGALLHDIGKMGIPDSILLKPGPLTDEEWQIMRQHPLLAYRLLSHIAYLRPALDIPYCHHEHWDGSGYPRGLKGEEIPLAARIFAIIDVWDALTSDRPYRPAWTFEAVQNYLLQNAGKQFDPHLVPIFLGLVKQTEETPPPHKQK